MRCPRCELDVAEDRVECPRCGVVFSKIGKHSVTPPAPRGATSPSAPAVAPAAAPAPASGEARVRLKARDRVVVMDALARGVRAGVPIVDFLRSLEVPDARVGHVVRRLSVQIDGGATLSEAWPRVVRNPGVAAPLLLAEAEQTGDLEGACVAIGRLDAQLLDLRAAVVGPLVKPLLSVVAACFLLPIPTAVLGSIGAYVLEVAGSLVLLGGVVAGLLLGLRAAAESPALAERMLEWPFGRDVDRWLLATVFEAALRAGAPATAVFGRLAEASGTVARRARFEAAASALAAGATFTDAMALMGVFDATARLEIRAGEASGELDLVFRGLARASAEQLARRLRLAATIVTFVASFVILGLLATRILATFEGVLGGTDDVLDQIDLETPIRALNQLQ